MSQTTLDNLIRAALMTRTEAFVNNPRESEPWSYQFAIAFKNHLENEANIWLASKGCAKYLRNGLVCSGIISSASEDEAVCDNCEAGRAAAKAYHATV